MSNYVFIRGVSYPWDEYRVGQSLPVCARTLCFGGLARTQGGPFHPVFALGVTEPANSSGKERAREVPHCILTWPDTPLACRIARLLAGPSRGKVNGLGSTGVYFSSIPLMEGTAMFIRSLKVQTPLGARVLPRPLI